MKITPEFASAKQDPGYKLLFINGISGKITIARVKPSGGAK